MERRAPLRLVGPDELAAGRRRVAGGELGLLGFLLAVNVIPLAGSAAGGRWGEGTLGFATAVSILCARELVRSIPIRRRSRR